MSLPKFGDKIIVCRDNVPQLDCQFIELTDKFLIVQAKVNDISRKMYINIDAVVCFLLDEE